MAEYQAIQRHGSLRSECMEILTNYLQECNCFANGDICRTLNICMYAHLLASAWRG